jgi:hypothetical protein
MALYKYTNRTNHFQIVVFPLNQEKVLGPNNSIEFDSNNLQSYVEIRSYGSITSLILDRVPLYELLIQPIIV